MKAVVPSPLLKSCLDSMSISATNNSLEDGEYDSDDDDIFVKTTKKSSSKKPAMDHFTETLLQKVGRNANTTLYYTNQSKLPNGGNGIIPEERNELVSAVQKSHEEIKENSKLIQLIHEKISLLTSEPLNEEIRQLLPLEESNVQKLYTEVNAARKLKVNESHLKLTKQKIENMSKNWRKRKRLCVDFLNMMDECTEGVVTAKKCLSGNGQIELESDEVVIKQAKQMFHNRKKTNNRQIIRGGNNNNEQLAHQSFVAVMLGSNCTIKRVFVEE